MRELEFTTENSEGIEQKVLPTYGVVIAQIPPARGIGDFDRALLVLAEQYVELHRPLPVHGTVLTSTTVTGMYDKGSGALVEFESVAVDPAGGGPLITTRSGMFIRGEGGFGGERGTAPPWSPPDRDPDHRVVERTRPEQALLYRLSGDRNPLHADPRFAARGGYRRPILHGPCTFGFAGRVLLHQLCGSDPARFVSMSGRFTGPVTPGDSLVVSIWRGAGGTASFQTAREDGTVVVDRGRVRYRPAPGLLADAEPQDVDGVHPSAADRLQVDPG
ncbi:MaoC family dehydratase [Phytohabitans suffuscus]|uniref:MaoC family dehydratase n=1 Tax=Phytohabitans suffuscus TaxID=624315 RepID=UPI001E4F2647|nr:MaoC family dehydratase [Phytohabitans suffuscus]